MLKITTSIAGIRNQDLQVFERLELNGILSAYTECVEAKIRPWFIPELVDAKIAPNCNNYLWQKGFTQPSIIVTGRCKAGKAVVVYSHQPNYFSDLENLKKVYQNGLVNGAGLMPQDEFLKLLDLADDKTVFVRDHQELMNAGSDDIKVSKALAHPMIIPFLGGKERAEQYLDSFSKKIGSKMFLGIANDLGDVSKGRWLVLSSIYIDGNLYGSCSFSNYGRVLGVESSLASEASPVIVPPKEDALKNTVPEAKPLEEKVQSALTEGRAFEFNGKLYVPVSAGNVKLS
jgi:hypothetical protein